MEADPQRVADTLDWLAKAQHDLQAASTLLEADQPLPDVAAFHAQQAAEKSLKAFLYWHDVPFRKTHQLDELGREAVEIDSGLQELVDSVIDLTPFAWRFRYPGEPMAPGLAEIADAVARAAALHAAVLERLPSEARPGWAA